MIQSIIMRRLLKRLKITVMGCLFLASCKNDNVRVYSSYYQYYPLKVGSYLVYNADSIKYTNSNQAPIADTIHYQLMDSIQSRFVDGTGQTSYRIQESIRSNSSQPWHILRVFSRSTNDRDAEEVDGNNRYVKLAFPVEANKQWNPNVYNTTDSSHIYNAQYIQVHQ